ncbi:unnamed protein product [Brassica rapa subsp. narinosa]|uniref:(rape) hypothetical protein n=1 Tax=Brassica napus TaxID=3708 RepID=A0A816XT69_BRANA|nr:unnamed protein product [Brassica napus]
MDSEIAYDFSPAFIIYKSGRIERLTGETIVQSSLTPHNGVVSKDVVYSPGENLSVRVFLPEKAAKTGEKLPLLVYFHGGAFIIETPFSPTYHTFLTTSVSASRLHSSVGGLPASTGASHSDPLRRFMDVSQMGIHPHRRLWTGELAEQIRRLQQSVRRRRQRRREHHSSHDDESCEGETESPFERFRNNGNHLGSSLLLVENTSRRQGYDGCNDEVQIGDALEDSES